jgi:hypothetical protein
LKRRRSKIQEGITLDFTLSTDGLLKCAVYDQDVALGTRSVMQINIYDKLQHPVQPATTYYREPLRDDLILTSQIQNIATLGSKVIMFCISNYVSDEATTTS